VRELDPAGHALVVVAFADRERDAVGHQTEKAHAFPSKRAGSTDPACDADHVAPDRDRIRRAT
jgi:hypothetical protein